MGRPRRPLRRQLMASAAVCCSLLLLRHGGGGALAQRSGGGDDDDDSSRRNGNTVSPSGAPASASASATSSNGDDDGNNLRNGITPSPSVAATSSNGDEDDSNPRDGITPSPSASASLSNGDDDGSNRRNGGITPSPTGAPAPLGGDDDTSTQYPNCPGYTSHIRDGYCDSDLNVAACGWDGGDCCQCTCGQDLEFDEVLLFPCGLMGDGYDCQDPDVPPDCGATPSPAAFYGYPDCNATMLNFQNSDCNDDLNNAECGWDGGDCCRCTCRDYGYWDYGYSSCGASGFDCQDPEAPVDCPTPSPASSAGYTTSTTGWYLSPTTDDGYGYGYNGCTWSGDGMCDWSHNNEECEWDGGDCCSCDCVDTDDYECGVTGYQCLDPASSCFGTSSTNSYWTYSSNPFDDDAAGEVSGGEYHDDDATSNSPGYDSEDVVDIVDDDNDDLSEDGNRDFSSAADSTAVGVQDIAQDSSGSSFSDIEMAGVFVLSVSAFILFGCAALAACGFLRPRWCCSRPGDKGSPAPAAAAAAAGAGAGDVGVAEAGAGAGTAGAGAGAAAPAWKRRGWPWVRQKSLGKVQQGQEEAGRVVDEQEGKHAEEAELGQAFYSTGGASAGEAGSAREGDGGAAAGDHNGNSSGAVREGERDTSAPVVAGAGNGGNVAADEKEEEEQHGVEGGVGGETEGGAAEPEEAGETKTGGSTAVEEGGVGEATKGGAVADEAGEGEEKQAEQGSSTAADAAVEVKETTTADKPGAEGAAADTSAASDPPGKD